MSISFLKKGKDAKTALALEQKKSEERDKNKVYRFYLPTGKETVITFLDGQLDDDGLLAIPMYYEHQLFLNGHWRNWFVCTSDTEPCPICESGDSPSLVGALTVIDHSEWTSERDNKTYKDQIKLFIAKRNTIRLLQKAATKREGLAGCTFDVSRIGEKAPAVGDVFEFSEKRSMTLLKKLYKVDGPLNMEEVIHYHSGDELRDFGFGTKPVGSEGKKGQQAASEDYEDKL